MKNEKNAKQEKKGPSFDSSKENSSSADSSLKKVPIDEACLIEMMDGNMDYIHELEALFFKNLPVLMQDIQEGIHTKNSEKIQFAAHSIKGMCYNICADKAAEIALDIETCGKQNKPENAKPLVLALENEIKRLKDQFQSIKEKKTRQDRMQENVTDIILETDSTRRKTKVIVIDDELSQRLVLRKNLEKFGYEVLEAEDGSQGQRLLSEDPDIRLVITDLNMPNKDGYQLIESIREEELRYTYIIVLTARDDMDSLIRALSLGADDFLTKPVFPNELRLRLNSGGRLLRLESQEELIFSMAKLSEHRSEETGFHLERVKHYTKLLARDVSRHYPELRLSLSMADEISRISPLHDIGKVAISDAILHKPGKLTDEEFEIMKTHTTIGGKLIREIYNRTGSNYLWLGYEIAMFHHEKWNGKGYPEGLVEEEIPVSARSMALADVYDALTSERCYKKAFSHEKAKEIIMAERGVQFDPRFVDAFLREENEFETIRKRLQD